MSNKFNPKCPANTRACGRDTQSFVCLDNATPCPINDIHTSFTIDQKYETPDYTRLDITSDLYLYYSKTQINKQFVVNTELTDDHVCIYPGQNYSEYYYYVLMNKSTRLQCSTLPDTQLRKDERYSKMIPYKKRDLYYDNDLTYELRQLPGFTDYFLQGEQSLFKRGYLHWSNKCVEKGQTSKIKSISHIWNNFRKIRNYFWGVLFLFLIMVIVNVISMVVILKRTNIRYKEVIIGKIVLLLNFIAFILVTRSKNLQVEVKTFIDLFNDNICSDPTTNLILKESVRLFGKVENLMFVVFFILKFFVYLIIAFSFVIFVPLIYSMLIIKIKMISL